MRPAAGILYQWLLQQGVDSVAGVSGAPADLVLAVKEQGIPGGLSSSAPAGPQQQKGAVGAELAWAAPPDAGASLLA